ncbi:hypothetical protein Javan172_0026 [Streptococcus phage Javan172]|uniref:hypothetical protein n=1 Tax=Streptococcus dysgalactiae TaxID=1334 RepID=UPI00065056E8|nr:hypothetical protein [Streptococcus dysgalactiae]QBX24029.1 hypothetical protein Javan172_0026 [Streptococcus phage Javan172]
MNIEEAKKIVDKLSVDSDELWKIPMIPAHKVKALLDTLDQPKPEITHPKIKKPTNIKLGGLYYMPVLVTEMSIFAGVPGTCDVELEVELPNGNKMTSILDYFLNQGLIDLE